MGSLYQALETLDPGSTLGRVTRSLCTSVSSSSELLPLVLVWQAREACASARLLGPQPDLPCTLRPAGLSQAEAQRPEADDQDKPDTSDREVGPRPHVRVGLSRGLPRLGGRVLALTMHPLPQVGLSSESGATPSTPEEGPMCFCSKERRRGLQQKRKQALDSDPADLWGEGTAARGGGHSTNTPPHLSSHLEARNQPLNLSQSRPLKRRAPGSGLCGS